MTSSCSSSLGPPFILSKKGKEDTKLHGFLISTTCHHRLLVLIEPQIFIVFFTFAQTKNLKWHAWGGGIENRWRRKWARETAGYHNQDDSWRTKKRIVVEGGYAELSKQFWSHREKECSNIRFRRLNADKSDDDGRKRRRKFIIISCPFRPFRSSHFLMRGRNSAGVAEQQTEQDEEKCYWARDFFSKSLLTHLLITAFHSPLHCWSSRWRKREWRQFQEMANERDDAYYGKYRRFPEN